MEEEEWPLPCIMQTEEQKRGRPGNEASMHAEWRNVLLHLDAIILTGIQGNLSTHTSCVYKQAVV